MSRTRAGRMGYETRVNFIRNVGEVLESFAGAEWKYSAAETKAMIIERITNETGRCEVITFSQAYGELSGWCDKSFANISETGLSDMLADTFFQGARIFTLKAEYRLWVREVH